MLNNKWLYLAAGILLGLLGTVMFYRENKVITSTPKMKTKSITNASTIKVEPKKEHTEPDLVVTNKYVAKIDGVEVTAPTTAKKDEVTATVTTTIDVTPLVKQMSPKWELGVGLGYANNKLEYPISIQRNYKTDRALEVICSFDKEGKLKRSFVLHKWKI